MAEWGRKEYAKAWPSRRPVWTVAALLDDAGVRRDADGGGGSVLEGLPEERSACADFGAGGVEVHAARRNDGAKDRDGKEGSVFLKDDQVEPVTGPDEQQGWRLTEAGAKLCILRLQ